VCGISVYKKVLFFLIVDDLKIPVFLPRWLFQVEEKSIPADWICSAALGADVDLVAGPEFVARDLEAYVSVVDQVPESVDAIRRYCEEQSRFS
jgi:hypothetical protein